MSVATERKEHLGTQVGLDALLWGLLALLLLPAAVALNSLPWAQRAPAWLLPATMGAGAVVGVLLVLLRLPARWWWASALAAPLLGAGFVGGALIAAHNTPSDMPAAGTLLLGAYTATLAALAPWLVFRVRQAWLALVVVWITVAGVWRASLSPQQVWWLLILLIVSLTLLGIVHLRDEAQVWRTRHLERLGPVLWPSARAILSLSLLVALIGLIPLSAQFDVLRQWWNHSPAGQAGPLPFDTPHGAPVAVLGAPLGMSAPDVTGSQVILTYDILSTPTDPVRASTPTDAGDSALAVTPPLLGATLDTFDGAAWIQGGKTTNVAIKGALHPPEGTPVMQARITIHQLPQMANGSFLLGFDQPIGFSVPVQAHVAIGEQVGPLAIAAWEAATPLGQGAPYTITSTLLKPSATGSGALSPELQARLTATPSALTDELRTMAQSWVGDARTPAAQAAALLEGLQSHMKLDHQATPPAGVDGVEWFLQNKRGNVLLFTTTYILLGRTLHLPLRLAEGYLPGTYDDTSHHWIVRASDAAIWAQLAIPGVGWLDFFPASSEITVTVPSKIIYSGTAPVPTVTSTASASGATPQQPGKRVAAAGGPLSGGLPLLIGVLVLLLLVLFLVLLIAAMTLRWRLSKVGRRLAPLGQFFARVALLARLAGIRLRPSDTATQATAKVVAYVPEQSATLGSLNSAYERMRYGPPVVAQALTNLRAQWRQIRGALTRLVLTRPWRRAGPA